MQWKRLLRIAAAAGLPAFAVLRQTNCTVDLPNNVSVDPPPLVVDGDDDDDDDDGCDGFCIGS